MIPQSVSRLARRPIAVGLSVGPKLSPLQGCRARGLPKKPICGFPNGDGLAAVDHREASSIHCIVAALLTPTSTAMALQEVTAAFLRRCQASPRPLHSAWRLQCRQYATADSRSEEPSDLESTKFLGAAAPSTRPFDPVAKAKRRNRQLPPSRYEARDPYSRNPLPQ